ncbi:hypothetical protein [Cylindrospermum stagnale]|nr:hypothetical protein [Cylindrospermum stagnale]
MSRIYLAGLPDYEVVRDRILKKLKVDRQSLTGKVIDALIKELGKDGL